MYTCKIGGGAMSYNAKIRADAMSLNPIDDALFLKKQVTKYIMALRRYM